jgi:hypothetical protein
MIKIKNKHILTSLRTSVLTGKCKKFFWMSTFDHIQEEFFISRSVAPFVNGSGRY